MALSGGTHVWKGVEPRFRVIGVLGTGSFGVVAAAIDQHTGERVAIKKISGEWDEWDLRHIVREIKILRMMGPHPNIIGLKDVSVYEEALFITMELMECDLHRIIQSGQLLTHQHVQVLARQLLLGIKAMHDCGITHRDLKPQNVLVNSDCQLRITDFGQARVLHGVHMADDTGDPMEAPAGDMMTAYVTTRWYRAPEVMLGREGAYTLAVDLWSAGCIIGELLAREALFPGKSFLDQVNVILAALGAPDPSLPEAEVEEGYGFAVSADARQYLLSAKIPSGECLEDRLPVDLQEDALDFLRGTLVLHPGRRMTASQALAHPFLAACPPLPVEQTEVLVAETELDGLKRVEAKGLTLPQLKALIEEEVGRFGHGGERGGKQETTPAGSLDGCGSGNGARVLDREHSPLSLRDVLDGVREQSRVEAELRSRASGGLVQGDGGSSQTQINMSGGTAMAEASGGGGGDGGGGGRHGKPLDRRISSMANIADRDAVSVGSDGGLDWLDSLIDRGDATTSTAPGTATQAAGNAASGKSQPEAQNPSGAPAPAPVPITQGELGGQTLHRLKEPGGGSDLPVGVGPEPEHDSGRGSRGPAQAGHDECPDDAATTGRGNSDTVAGASGTGKPHPESLREPSPLQHQPELPVAATIGPGFSEPSQRPNPHSSDHDSDRAGPGAVDCPAHDSEVRDSRPEHTGGPEGQGNGSPSPGHAWPGACSSAPRQHGAATGAGPPGHGQHHWHSWSGDRAAGATKESNTAHVQVDSATGSRRKSAPGRGASVSDQWFCRCQPAAEAVPDHPGLETSAAQAGGGYPDPEPKPEQWPEVPATATPVGSPAVGRAPRPLPAGTQLEGCTCISGYALDARGGGGTRIEPPGPRPGPRPGPQRNCGARAAPPLAGGLDWAPGHGGRGPGPQTASFRRWEGPRPQTAPGPGPASPGNGRLRSHASMPLGSLGTGAKAAMRPGVRAGGGGGGGSPARAGRTRRSAASSTGTTMRVTQYTAIVRRRAKMVAARELALERARNPPPLPARARRGGPGGRRSRQRQRYGSPQQHPWLGGTPGPGAGALDALAAGGGGGGGRASVQQGATGGVAAAAAASGTGRWAGRGGLAEAWGPVRSILHNSVDALALDEGRARRVAHRAGERPRRRYLGGSGAAGSRARERLESSLALRHGRCSCCGRYPPGAGGGTGEVVRCEGGRDPEGVVMVSPPWGASDGDGLPLGITGRVDNGVELEPESGTNRSLSAR